jgi:hydrocephalus-inducing protein
LRPPTAPESYLQKCYINSEGCFDFGPLLIKKDPEKRADETVQKVNGTFFQITNNGKYKLDAQFILKSSLPVEERLAGDEGIVPDKSPFIMEPQEMSLAVGETKNLNVYAFPQDAQLYSDQIIALIKDNPNPSIFNVQCLGAKPVVTVSSEKIEFERALLERTNEKVLKLTNTCAIPVNWKLSGCEKLPEEFEVSVQSGTLKPCQEVEVNIIFKAIAEKKFTETITLEVEDVEEYGIKQDNKPIVLEAEAFKISLNEELKINQELDFKAVRVGEPKTMTIPLKNMGMYPIKYFFNMSKDSTKENFTIEPMEEKIDPGQERSIKVRFMSKKELKLKNMADIKLNILEGDLNVEFQTIPIMVSVNAVFSKYTISPLRNINFGPMQFGEQQTRTFEIRNEGLFEFKYNICDILDEEGKQKIREERQKELEERLGIEQEDEAAAAAGKGGKPAAKKEAAKAPPKKGAKEVVPDGSVCKVSHYEIQPAIGAIAPGSASIVNVVFNAQGD